MTKDTDMAAGLPDALKLLMAMARGASDPAIIEIAGAPATGLPAAVPIGFDRHAQQAFSIRQLVEEWRHSPERRKGTAVVDTLEAFIDLANRHKDADSALFGAAVWPSPSLTAVIDYHRADGEARFGEHRISYPFPVTEEFAAWAGNDGRAMEQAEFAAFIEEHLAELAAPFDTEKAELERLFKVSVATPQDVLMLSRDLEVHVGAKIKRQERMQSGERVLTFEEAHTDASGQPVRIPGAFVLSLPAFVDGAPVRIAARLRYRAGGGGVMWSYHLYRWRDMLRQAVCEALDDAARETGLPAYLGKPER